MCASRSKVIQSFIVAERVRKAKRRSKENGEREELLARKDPDDRSILSHLNAIAQSSLASLPSAQSVSDDESVDSLKDLVLNANAAPLTPTNFASSFIAEINSKLGRDVRLSTENAAEEDAVLTDETSLATLKEDKPVMRLPDWYAETLRSQFMRRDVPEEDILFRRLQRDRTFKEKFFLYWGEIQAALNYEEFVRNKEHYLLVRKGDFFSTDASSCKEISTSQVLFGSPIWHTAITHHSHYKFATIPRSFDAKDFNWISGLGDYLRDSKGCIRAEKLTLPRTTSQGCNLRAVGESPEFKFFVKVLKALIGVKASSFEEVEKVYQGWNSIYREFGYSEWAMSFNQGIRRQQTNKPEVIHTANEWDPYSHSPIISGYSYACQGRVRGIFMVDELTKAFHKRYCDGLKACLFERTSCFATDPDEVTRKQFWMTNELRNLGKDANGLHPGFLDLSEFDTRQHRGLYDAYYACVSACFPDFASREGTEHIAKFGVLAPITIGTDSPIIRHGIEGRSTLSGEPAVTVKNNILHLAMICTALARETGVHALQHAIDFIEGRGKYHLLLHGDDCVRYFGDDLDLYDRIDAHMASFGMKVGREMGPFFLKKRAISASKRVGLMGSLMKNRFSEYGVTEPAILLLGLYDTLQLMDSSSYQRCARLWDLISEYCTPFGRVSQLSWSFILSEIMPRIQELTKSNTGKAREVQEFLSRLYYAGGQDLPDDLIELYGAFDYDIEESGENIGIAHLQFDDLVTLSNKLIRLLCTSNGYDPSWKDIVSEFT